MRAKLPVLICVLVLSGCGTSSKREALSVYPLPGSRTALAQTQISFRGAPAQALGRIVVRGSSSGVHDGALRAHSDGDGASFVPARPFAPGEVVTVTTKLNVVGGRRGAYSFTVARPAAAIRPMQLPLAATRSGDVARFHSRPDLQPATVSIGTTTGDAHGYIFLTPQNGPLQNGPLILDPQGRVVWFHPYSPARKLTVTDFRVQNLYGQPVLTWWQGYENQGNGVGEGVIFDQHYRQLATVHASNGLSADLHEFLLTPGGDAYLTAVSPVFVAGIRKPVLDAVVQEVDIRTGLVLFEWHALDHIPLTDSEFPTTGAAAMLDPYHLNSVWPEDNGNLIVSMRNTSAVYEIDRRSGRVIWTLGGKHPTLAMGRGTETGFQHAAIMGSGGTLTLFDNGGGPPRVRPYSRGIRVAVGGESHGAALLGQYRHVPALAANLDGNLQPLPGGDVFLGWGQRPYFSQYDPAGRLQFDGRFNAAVTSYRAYRFQWIGTPQTAPAVVATDSGGKTNVYTSWNGATEVAGWRVFGGGTPAAVRPVASAATWGFETRVQIPRQRYVSVQALDHSGQVLASSAVVRVG